jgi:hypothetical protein
MVNSVIDDKAVVVVFKNIRCNAVLVMVGIDIPKNQARDELKEEYRKTM